LRFRRCSVGGWVQIADRVVWSGQEQNGKQWVGTADPAGGEPGRRRLLRHDISWSSTRAQTGRVGQPKPAGHRRRNAKEPATAEALE
jgi:hypothetical protein